MRERERQKQARTSRGEREKGLRCFPPSWSGNATSWTWGVWGRWSWTWWRSGWGSGSAPALACKDPHWIPAAALPACSAPPAAVCPLQTVKEKMMKLYNYKHMFTFKDSNINRTIRIGKGSYMLNWDKASFKSLLHSTNFLEAGGKHLTSLTQFQNSFFCWNDHGLITKRKSMWEKRRMGERTPRIFLSKTH